LPFCIAKMAPNNLYLPKFSGGLRPPSPPPGLRPWTPLGAAPPDPCQSSLGGASATSLAKASLRSATVPPLGQSVPPLEKYPRYASGQDPYLTFGTFAEIRRTSTGSSDYLSDLAAELLLCSRTSAISSFHLRSNIR